MPDRTTVGFVMLGVAVLAAAAVAYLLVGGSIEATLAVILVTFIAIGLMGSVVLLGLATESVSTAAAIAWAMPGATVLVQYGLVVLQRVFDSPLGLGGVLTVLGIASVGGGAMSPITSVAATGYAWRSKRLAQVCWATVSWLGAVAFWGKASGLILQEW